MVKPRYLFMSMPQQPLLNAMRVIVDRYGLATQLGLALFVPTNWHQSLSDRHWEEDTPDLRERMLRAGGRVSAQAVAMMTLSQDPVPFGNRIDRHEEVLEWARSSCHEEEQVH
ncbi:hypothetical protein [Pelomonas sp. Root1237]|uniref:hypothetical protein n=1 Tax=Pelomonas sp. Root1237 TaxID=1736434 RepID=UPI0006F33848|nr:hypothetical protein [Pelomonas sp. Root1237]KQV86590.1 hypothetical protein ASC91_22430 [Pelomonas sp. Root1237]